MARKLARIAADRSASRHGPEGQPRRRERKGMGLATLFDKIWDRHVVADFGDGYALLHVSRHLMHDGGSPAFAALKERGFGVLNPELKFATFDHVISTLPGRTAETDPALTPRLYSMREDARAAGVRLFDLGEPGQGIAH